MQNLRAALAETCSHILTNFPIHRGLKRVLDGKCAAFDK